MKMFLRDQGTHLSIWVHGISNSDLFSALNQLCEEIIQDALFHKYSGSIRTDLSASSKYKHNYEYNFDL